MLGSFLPSRGHRRRGNSRSSVRYSLQFAQDRHNQAPGEDSLRNLGQFKRNKTTKNAVAHNPQPKICTKCHLSGHKVDACSNQQRCAVCRVAHFVKEECKTLPICINCGGFHVALDDSCPKRAIATKYAKPVSRPNPRAVGLTSGKTATPVPALKICAWSQLLQTKGKMRNYSFDAKEKKRPCTTR